MDFNKVIDRKGTYCTQWDYIEDRFGKGTKDITPFSISDMDFKSPKPIIQDLQKVLEHGIFGYTRWNHDDFKNSIVNWYKKRYDTIIESSWITYSPAVIYSISLLIELLLKNKNEIIMTHTPCYDGFRKILLPYNVIYVPLKEISTGKYETDFDLIETNFKKGIKIFLLCNPENPTGKVWRNDELEKLIYLCKKYNVTLISDDIHMDITRITPTPILKISNENCIIVSSASKTFNTPSLGGSYCIIPNNEIREQFINHLKNVDALNSPTIMGVISTMSAYTKCEEWVKELNSYILHNCEYVMRELNGFKNLKVYVPEGTYLMWIDFSESKISPKEFQDLLINIGKVGIMSGEVYGDSYKLRLNVGCPISKVQIGVNGIKKALEFYYSKIK